MNNNQENLDQIAINKLIEYIRIRTDHPNPDYNKAIEFIKEYSEEIGFDSYKTVEVSSNRIITILSYYGIYPEKPSILLNSHIDVVPCDLKYWKCDPFEGKVYENGDIYGRGTQDMKSIGIQHLELIRRMKLNNLRPERTIHITFVPDEEIGGLTGFAPFLDTQEFKDLNIGFALDEGMPSPNDEFNVFYTERLFWWLHLTFRGNAGHGSRFIEKTAAEKLHRLMNRLLGFREKEKTKLHSECSCMKLGDVTTVNLTQLSGGLAQNLVPAEFHATFDLRVTPKSDAKEFEKQLLKWIDEAEGDDKDSGRITYEFINKRTEFDITSTDEEKNPWSKIFRNAMSQMNLKYTEEIFPAGTDIQFLRERGIPAFGFSPINNTPILMHDHNEFLNEKIFLKGIEIFYNIVLNLANMP